MATPTPPEVAVPVIVGEVQKRWHFAQTDNILNYIPDCTDLEAAVWDGVDDINDFTLYLRTIDFRTLLKRFNAGNRELTAATVEDVQPILKEYVTRNGLGETESKDLIDSLSEENMEDTLLHHGLLVDEEPSEGDFDK